MSWKHYAMMALTGVGAAATAVANAYPDASGICHVVAEVCQAATMVLGFASAQVLGKGKVS
jgi:hypothetical protein